MKMDLVHIAMDFLTPLSAN